MLCTVDCISVSLEQSPIPPGGTGSSISEELPQELGSPIEPELPLSYLARFLIGLWEPSGGLVVVLESGPSETWMLGIACNCRAFA